ncbi:IS66 family insertion sequence element accessory protein TnpB [Ensifer sp. B1-9]|uniref:IS66 family insertion sequence element accessory protein TnpB n=1 Tax=Ensifer sp. B1-9 TaxID=3141455 RepID=UPI003D1A766B
MRAGSRGHASTQMIPISSGVRVWIASGHCDMRKGMQGLALLVQEGLGRDPFKGDVFVFRGRSGRLIKALWHDGIGPIAVCEAARVKRTEELTHCELHPSAFRRNRDYRKCR